MSGYRGMQIIVRQSNNFDIGVHFHDGSDEGIPGFFGIAGLWLKIPRGTESTWISYRGCGNSIFCSGYFGKSSIGIVGAKISNTGNNRSGWIRVCFAASSACRGREGLCVRICCIRTCRGDGSTSQKNHRSNLLEDVSSCGCLVRTGCGLTEGLNCYRSQD